MKSFLDEQTKNQLVEVFSRLEKKITLIRFTKNDCEHCHIVEKLFNELKELGSLLEIKTYNIDENLEVKKKFKISDAPSYIILNSDDKPFGATFYGVPAGHEFNTLITCITDAGSTKEPFNEEILKTIKAIVKPIDIKVFVTASCPNCPKAAINLSRLAQINNNITTAIYESQTFSNLAEKYEVTGIPKIIINETKEITGNKPIEEYLKTINSL